MSTKQLLILGAGVVSTLWFQDSETGIKFGIRHVRPTGSQRVEWNSILYRRDKKGRLVGNLAEANITVGRKLIVGIEPGCIAGPDGVAMSSDPGTPGYREDWRSIVVDSGCLDSVATRLAIMHLGDAQFAPSTPIEAAAQALIAIGPHLDPDLSEEKIARLLLLIMDRQPESTLDADLLVSLEPDKLESDGISLDTPDESPVSVAVVTEGN